MRKILFGTIMIALSCNEINTDKKDLQKDTIQIATDKQPDTINELNKTSAANAVTYKYQNDKIVQTLKLISRTSREINFELISFNKEKTKASTLIGIAKSKPTQDSEMDEDDEGNAYRVIEYHYVKEGCSLSIRIDLKTKDKANVLEYNCDKTHERDCPFASQGVLKKL